MPYNVDKLKAAVYDACLIRVEEMEQILLYDYHECMDMTFGDKVRFIIQKLHPLERIIMGPLKAY